MRLVRGDGVDLALYEQGEPGQPVVLLVHGYPDTHAIWDGVAEVLRERFHVVRYDVRGAGASERPRDKESYAFQHLMADMRAVLDAVSPDRPVHLVGHDWGSLQAWEAVCTFGERFASYTSISGPCLDHIGHQTRRNLRRPSTYRKALRQARHSWYIAAFQTPVIPELVWHAGLARHFGTLLERLEGVPKDGGHLAPTLAEDGAAGVNLYRANMRPRLRHPKERRTSVPVQIIVPVKDAYVSPYLIEAAPPWTEQLWIRPVPDSHWVAVKRPDVIARLITEHVKHAEGGEPSRGLRKSRVKPENQRREFEGHLVVVTGAGSGIGRATALTFAERGAEVIAADVDPETAKRTAELCALLGPPAHARRVDVSDAAQMEEFAKSVRHEHGVPDLVINNAGIGVAGPFLDHSAADWERVVAVNLMGVVHGSRLFAAQMAEQGEGGHIVNTASAAAFTPARTMAAYCASKAAVLMLSECAGADLAGKGIKVSAICPGIVDTNITRTARFAGSSPAQQDRQRARAARAYGLRGYGPEKVADRILAAVRTGRPVVPVTPEAHLARLMSRLSPALMRRLARIDPTPRRG